MFGRFQNQKSASGEITLESIAAPEGIVLATEGGTVWTPYTLATDRLGSVRAIVDMSSGTVVERNDYYPYGKRITSPSTEAGTYPQLATNRWRFSGKEEQDSLAFTPYLDFGARQYDPEVATWLAPDPLSTDYPGLSPYVYCAADPGNLVDPEGKTIYIWYGKGNKEFFRYTGLEADNMIPDNAYVRSVIEAYKYNQANWENAGFKEDNPLTQLVEREDITVSIYSDTELEDQHFRGNGGTQYIIWNPNEGMETDLGSILSPATLLVHEADHALDDALNAKAHSDRKGRKRTDGYTNDEEYRVIIGSEQRTALANGEIKRGNKTRTAHHGTTIITSSPVSIVVLRRK